MALLDLFALAEMNEAALAAELDARRSTFSGEHSAHLGLFCQVVGRRSGVSMNMKPWKMRQFLLRGRYASIYEIAEEKAVAAGHSKEEAIRALQGSYYERRVLFDRSFVDGERFLYGALNIGGAGADYYGVFCVLLDSAATGAWSTAFLPANSLDRYVKPAAVLALDEAALRREVATPAQRHSLAGLKHADDIAVVEEPDWPGMLCSGECFVEALFIGDVTLKQISEFRLKQDEMRRLSDLAFDAMLGKLAATDRGEVDDFQSCMKMLDASGLLPRVKEV